MRSLQSRLLLSAFLLIVSVGPSLAASCSPRMSPLRCLIASLHALQPPPQWRAKRHAVRPKPVAKRVAARTSRRGQAARVARGGHRRGTSPPRIIATRPAPSVAAAVIPTAAQAAAVPATPERAPQVTSLIGAPVASIPEQATAKPDPAAHLDVSADAAALPDAAASAGGSAVRIAVAPPPGGAPEGRAPSRVAAPPAAQGAPAWPAEGSSIRRLFGLSGDASPAAPGPMVGGAAEPEIELRPLPAAFVELRPYLADLRYFIAEDRVVLVLPETRLVVMTY